MLCQYELKKMCKSCPTSSAIRDHTSDSALNFHQMSLVVDATEIKRIYKYLSEIQLLIFIKLLYIHVPASFVFADRNSDQGPRRAPVTAATTNSYVVKAVRFPNDISGDCVLPSLTTL